MEISDVIAGVALLVSIVAATFTGLTYRRNAQTYRLTNAGTGRSRSGASPPSARKPAS